VSRNTRLRHPKSKILTPKVPILLFRRIAVALLPRATKMTRQMENVVGLVRKSRRNARQIEDVSLRKQTKRVERRDHLGDEPRHSHSIQEYNVVITVRSRAASY
jgi:hypothetical protein